MATNTKLLVHMKSVRSEHKTLLAYIVQDFFQGLYEPLLLFISNHMPGL